MMMEIRKEKFWPDAEVPEGAVYLGGITGASPGERCDFYICGDRGIFVWNNLQKPSCPISAIETDGGCGGFHSSQALDLIRAHRAKATHQPEPAQEQAGAKMGREEMIEAAAKAAYERVTPSGKLWKWDDIEPDEKANRLGEMESALIAIEKIQPTASPAKTESEMIVDPFRDILGPDDASSIEDAIDAALAARDEEHRKELEALREAIASDFPHRTVKAAIRAVPLTIAERAAARPQ